MIQAPGHEPVMVPEVLELLAPRPGGRYCDATVGMGGHARAVLERSAPDGRLVGLDRDPEALEVARAALAEFGDRVTLVRARFSRLRSVLEELRVAPVDGIVVDLGVSSPQLDRGERGFSFRQSGPLDMRMDGASGGESAADLIARVDEGELAIILRTYGEERYAGRIARAICEARDRGELGSTAALASVVARAMPHHERHKNPATRTFQALRIVVNDELGELERLLEQLPDCLAPGGRICIIAFHSLEDRIVKHRLRAMARPPEGGAPRMRLLTKHIVTAGDEELRRNPRARSAKLRAAERI